VGACPGGALSSQCGANRLPADDNLLCGKCQPGFSEWSGQCVECPAANAAMIILLIAASFLFVLFIYMVSARHDSVTAGTVGIFIYFWQTTIIVAGPTASWLRAFSFLQFDVKGVSSGMCVVPLTAFERLALDVLEPLLFVAELGLLMLLHKFVIDRCLVPKRRETQSLPRVYNDIANGDQDVDPAPLSPSSSIRAAEAPLSGPDGNSSDRSVRKDSPVNDNERRNLFDPLEWRFNTAAYARTLVALVFFSYSRITQVVFQYLNCVDVRDTSVVQAFPEINCESPLYLRWRVVIILMLVLVVIGVPAFVLYILWRERRKVERCYTAQGSFKIEFAAFRRFGIFFEPFMHAFRWWHAVILIRRMLTLAIFIFATDAQGTKYALLGALHCLSLIVNVWCRPYRVLHNNSLETVQLFVLTMITFCIVADPVPPHNDGQIAAISLLFLVTFFGALAYVALQMPYVRSKLGLKRAQTFRSPRSADDISGAGTSQVALVPPSASRTPSLQSAHSLQGLGTTSC